MFGDARVGAAGEDPCPGGLGGLQETLPKAPVKIPVLYVTHMHIDICNKVGSYA